MKSLLSELDQDLINSALHNAGISEVVDLQIMDSVASTNDQVMASLQAADNMFNVCLANQQTAGRGRNGAAWVSPPNANIYLSVGTVFDAKLLNRMGGLSLACGVAIARLLRSLNVNVGLKWPNDILVEQKKLAGILLETRIKSKRVYVVVGIGINVQMPDAAAAEIDQPWIDLATILESRGEELSRSELAAKLLIGIVSCIKQFEISGFDSFANDWQQFEILTGKRVLVNTGDVEVEGIVLGVTDDFALKVCVNNEEKVFYAADIKLKLN